MPARRVTIDLTELEKLCVLQCTDEEIAAWFGTSTRTIERRRKEPKFAEVMERGKAKGRISVRRMQLKLLEGGNATMAVWLGKQLLGQRDQIATEGRPLPSLRDLTTEDLRQVLADYRTQFPELTARVEAITAQFSVVESEKPFISPPTFAAPPEKKPASLPGKSDDDSPVRDL